MLGRRGVILYKAMWTAAGGLRAFLEGFEPDRALGPGRAYMYTEQVQVRRSADEEFFRLLERNGPRAVTEFRRAMEVWSGRARRARREG